MRATAPPRLATWLMKRVAPGPKPECLMGDLIEQYRRGRSSAWYWRQVLAAILAGTARDVREHKLLACRALAMGFALTYAFGAVEPRFTSILGRWQVSANNWMLASGFEQSRLWWWRLHLHNLSGTIVWCVAFACIAWVVGRTHHTQRFAMVLIYLALLIVWDVGLLNLALQNWLTRPNSLNAFLSFVLYSGFVFVAIPCSVLLGGLWTSPSENDGKLVH